MMFVTLLKSLPGKYTQAIRLIKNRKVPEGIKLHMCLGLFGDYDCMMVYEAENETMAAQFVIQFEEAAHPTTFVAFPAGELRWTK